MPSSLTFSLCNMPGQYEVKGELITTRNPWPPVLFMRSVPYNMIWVSRKTNSRSVEPFTPCKQKSKLRTWLWLCSTSQDSVLCVLIQHSRGACFRVPQHKFLNFVLTGISRKEKVKVFSSDWCFIYVSRKNISLIRQRQHDGGKKPNRGLGRPTAICRLTADLLLRSTRQETSMNLTWTRIDRNAYWFIEPPENVFKPDIKVSVLWQECLACITSLADKSPHAAGTVLRSPVPWNHRIQSQCKILYRYRSNSRRIVCIAIWTFFCITSTLALLRSLENAVRISWHVF